MLDRNKWIQFGQPLEKGWKGITIHNTGNELSASELAEKMEEATDHLATHFFVDENEVIQMMPLDWCVWHTGKGKDYGNTRTIAVEICRSTCSDEVYKEAQRNAIDLIKELMKQFGFTKDNIYFHKDFNNTFYCPHRILDIYKTKQNFKETEL